MLRVSCMIDFDRLSNIRPFYTYLVRIFDNLSELIVQPILKSIYVKQRLYKLTLTQYVVRLIISFLSTETIDLCKNMKYAFCSMGMDSNKVICHDCVY